MNISQIIIVFAFFASLGASVIYFINGKKKFQRLLPIAARLYDIGTLAGVIASFAMLYYLLTHQFQYDYVVKYSSIHQPFVYLVSALWAGQEGTFLFWVMVVGVMGWVFRYIMSKSFETFEIPISFMSIGKGPMVLRYHAFIS